MRLLREEDNCAGDTRWLGPTQCGVLRLLAEGPHTEPVLRRALGVARPNLGYALRSLMRRGLVTRRRAGRIERRGQPPYVYTLAAHGAAWEGE